MSLNRCAKVVKGGRRFSYAAVMVVGDGHGHVGIGMGKARETPEAIRKGIEQAKKNLFAVPLHGRTIPHLVREKFGAADVLLKPAATGTGVIAGGAVRAVVEAAGIHDVLSKSLGSPNKVNVVRATEMALRALTTADEVSSRRGVRLRGVRATEKTGAAELAGGVRETPGDVQGVVPQAMEAAQTGNPAAPAAAKSTAAAMPGEAAAPGSQAFGQPGAAGSPAK